MTVESTVERQGMLTAVLAEVVKTVRFDAIRQPINMPHKDLAAPVRDCAKRQLGHLSAEQQRQLIDLLRAARTPHEEETEW